MITKAFRIKCLTNLHVGNGDVNFNIIDNEVEKDPVTDYPTINSTGVKGALREHFEVKFGKGSDDVKNIFGAEGDGNPGKIKFLAANLLARPMRASEGDEPFYMVTTSTAVELYNQLNTGLSTSAPAINCAVGSAKGFAEGIECSVTDGLKSLGIDKALVMGDKEFREIPLPVVARNCLENGKSTNLWYEEIVPHESVFYFVAIANDGDVQLLDKFAHTVVSDVVQFGGNSTVGYGLCEITEIGGAANE